MAAPPLSDGRGVHRRTPITPPIWRSEAEIGKRAVAVPVDDQPRHLEPKPRRSGAGATRGRVFSSHLLGEDNGPAGISPRACALVRRHPHPPRLSHKGGRSSRPAARARSARSPGCGSPPRRPGQTTLTRCPNTTRGFPRTLAARLVAGPAGPCGLRPRHPRRLGGSSAENVSEQDAPTSRVASGKDRTTPTAEILGMAASPTRLGLISTLSPCLRSSGERFLTP